MIPVEDLKQSIFKISTREEMERCALNIFRYQYENNLIYRKFVDYLNTGPERVKKISEIPFLPVSLFRDHVVISGSVERYDKIFTSSGTTGSIPSKHFVKDCMLYEDSFLASFRLYYGDHVNYRFLALLPGYLERQGSSLVYMMEYLVKSTKANGSGFFLHDFSLLKEKLQEPKRETVKTILFGASYALLDFAESNPVDLNGIIVMETGGMKGRRQEMIREELHEFLRQQFNVDKIHSEYGMTELLTQAYSAGGGIFRTPPWMQVMVRDTNDPFDFLPPGKTGGINIIDLANLHGCAFIATQDLGKLNENGSFEILGRFDDSDIRGCNLLVV